MVTASRRPRTSRRTSRWGGGRVAGKGAGGAGVAGVAGVGFLDQVIFRGNEAKLLVSKAF